MEYVKACDIALTEFSTIYELQKTVDADYKFETACLWNAIGTNL